MHALVRIHKCSCGQIPKLKRIGEWPAQYQVECMCGKIVLGEYYGHQDPTFRKNKAMKHAIKNWTQANNGLSPII